MRLNGINFKQGKPQDNIVPVSGRLPFSQLNMVKLHTVFH